MDARTKYSLRVFGLILACIWTATAFVLLVIDIIGQILNK